MKVLRGLLGTSCLIAAAGCVALNPGFEDGAADRTESSGPSDTEGRTASESDPGPSASGSSAVTTVTAGSSSSGEPTDSGGVTTVSDETGPTPTSSDDESTGGLGTSSDETGGVPCIPSTALVEDDAFLIDCGGRECASRNYGRTEFGPLAEGFAESGALLLGLPESSETAVELAVTVELVASGELADAPVTIYADPIDPPCAWAEGPLDGGYLTPGVPGATFIDCNGDPGVFAPWGDMGAGTVWDHVNLDWSVGVTVLEAGTFPIDTPFVVTVLLSRRGPGDTPGAIAITADVESLQLLMVSSAEDLGFEPLVTVYNDCP